MENTVEQNECIKFLESLVQNRYTLKQLEEVLSEYFKEEIKIEDITPDDLSEGTHDYNLLFGTNQQTSLHGFFDIYYLPVRTPDATMYITEIGFEFD